MKKLLKFFVLITALSTISLVTNAANVTKQLHIVQLVNLNNYINTLFNKAKDDPFGTISGPSSVYMSDPSVTFYWSGDAIPAGAFWDLDYSFTSYRSVTPTGAGGLTYGSINIDPTDFGTTGTHLLTILYPDGSGLLYYATEYRFIVYY